MTYTIHLVVSEQDGRGRLTHTVGDYLLAAMRGDEPPSYDELQMVLASVLVMDRDVASVITQYPA